MIFMVVVPANGISFWPSSETKYIPISFELDLSSSGDEQVIGFVGTPFTLMNVSSRVIDATVSSSADVVVSVYNGNSSAVVGNIGSIKINKTAAQYEADYISSVNATYDDIDANGFVMANVSTAASSTGKAMITLFVRPVGS